MEALNRLGVLLSRCTDNPSWKLSKHRRGTKLRLPDKVDVVFCADPRDIPSRPTELDTSTRWFTYNDTM